MGGIRPGWLAMGAGLLCVAFGLLVVGSWRGSFSAHGRVSSAGGALGDWAWVPKACTRDSVLGPMEGLPVSRPQRTVLTLLWPDPYAATLNPQMARRQGPEQPLRVAVLRDGAGVRANVYTHRLPWGTAIRQEDCRVLRVEAQEHGFAVRGRGRPVLDGTLTMDCRVEGSRVRAEVRFENCAW